MKRVGKKSLTPADEAAIILNGAIYLVLAILTLYMILFIFPAFYARVNFTGSLEQQEDTFLNTVLFFNNGGNIYQLPDLHFAGSIYPPLYIYVISLISSVFGLSFFVSRLFSLACIGGTAWCAYLMIRHYTNNRWISLAWLPLWLSIWPLYGWSDLARPEALFLFLMFAGSCALVKAETRRGFYILAGCLFGLCFATKQTGLIFLPAACVISLFDRRALWTAGAMLGMSALVYGVSYALFGYGMIEWLVLTPYHHIIDYAKGFYVLKILLTQCTGIVIFLLAFLITFAQARDKKEFLTHRYLLLLVLCGAGFITTFASMFKDGGGVPNLANFHAFALLAGCCISAEALQGRVRKKVWVLAALSLMVVFVFESFLDNSIADHKPAPEASIGYDRLVDLVRNQPGDVWVTTKPWLIVKAGKQPFMAMQQMAGEWANGNPDFPLPADLVEAIASKKFSMIVSGEEYIKPWLWPTFAKLMQDNYQLAGELPPDMVLRLYDGSPFASHYVWVPR